MKIHKFRPRHEQYRRDWVRFFRRTVPDAVWQRLAETCPASGDPRVRWVTTHLVLAWVLIGWSLQTSLKKRLAEARRWLARRFPARRRCGATYQGLLKATDRMGAGLLQQFWRNLRATVVERLGCASMWYGWTVLAVDGSRFDAPRTRANAKRLGQAGRNHTAPQWWVTWLVHLPTLLVWDWRQGPGGSSERKHLEDMIAGLPKSVLLVADAGYVGFDMMKRLIESGVDFLIRCGGNVRLLVEDADTTVCYERNHCVVRLWPKNRRNQLPLVLRLIVLKRHGKRVYLLTSVMEERRLSRPMAGEIYQARWGVEVEFRSLKRTLERYRVLSKTPGPGAMELAAYVLSLALLMLEGAVALGREVVRLSVAEALSAVRDALEWLRNRSWGPALEKTLREALRDDYRRRRPKQSRHWPRKKNDHPPGPPKFQRLTQRETARINTILSQHATTLG